MSNRIQIKPELFQWAQERSQLSLDKLCEKFPKYPKWMSGELNPTMKQLEKFADQTYTPFGFFFLPEPPVEHLPIQDFRTVSDQDVPPFSPHLLDTIYAVQMRQEWMRNFLIEEGEPPLAFIGSRTLLEAPEAVAVDIRVTLGLAPLWSRNLKTWEEALRTLIQHIEAAGVLVMINGVVENNTHRPLSVKEFRGFVLSDSHAPVIFINGTDAKAAQMFTLVHELAHLWLGQAGISDFNELLPSDNAVEIFCNKVAAEFLIPANEMTSAWHEVKEANNPFERLARVFNVSPVVVARRALDLKLVSRADYFAFYWEYKKAAAKRKSQSSKGGDFYVTLGTKLGKRFSSAVYIAAKEGRLPYREAYHLTGLSGETYDRFGRKFGLPI